MSRNIMTITKWLPLENEENKNLFSECKQLKNSCKLMFEQLGKHIRELQFKNMSKIHHLVTDNGLEDKLKNITEMMERLVNGFNKAFEKLTGGFDMLITQAKLNHWKHILWILKLKICYFLQQLVNETAFLFIYYGEKILVLTLRISKLYNECIAMDVKFSLSENTSLCSNTCPYLMYPLRKMSITKLLQILVQNRAELCCHKLIDCLLDTYKFYDTHDEDNSSDNSSIEIYRAITKHMSPQHRTNENSSKLDIQNYPDLEDNGSFMNMEELINYEEQNILDLLAVAVKIAPSMLGNDSIKKSKTGEIRISSKAKHKVLDYYQEILWGEVGNFLEHVILWWGASPLSVRPPHSSQHLREWIMQFTPSADTPPFIISTLSCLVDALGVHITSTSWDYHFRLALVASKSPGNPETGRFFCEMLQDLISLSNQFELTSDWVLGAPLEELPLVEQIPVLHRLDHSVHTTRLWAVIETKKQANNWDVSGFFAVTHTDVGNCLVQLNNLKLADHTDKIEKGGLGVHVEVCAKMREKIVSEVRVNIQKLKETPGQCVNCLASVCRTVSLAQLQMIFPGPKYWNQNGNEMPEKPNSYVEKYLDYILTPVLATTEDHHICNMVLKIMCEAWLDNIYTNKIKFSHIGALQLLTDFASVEIWLSNCPSVSQGTRKKMIKNEVLRRCEGVGRLLLRFPGEHIKMNNKTGKNEPEDSPESENAEMMPAEMYVPNQEQWLELRAGKKRAVFMTSFCCGNK